MCAGRSHFSFSFERAAAQPATTAISSRFQGLRPWMPRMVFGMSGCSTTAISRIKAQSDLYQSFEAYSAAPMT